MFTSTRYEIEALQDRQGVRPRQLEERRLLRQARGKQPKETGSVVEPRIGPQASA